MSDKFLLVNTSVLPDYFIKVVKTTELVSSGDMSISEACEEMQISRSTFYKYRNKVFRSTREYQNKSILSFKMVDEKGVLSSALKIFFQNNINIISINQALPIRNYSYVIVMVDLSEASIDLSELTKQLKQANGIKSVNVVFE